MRALKLLAGAVVITGTLLATLSGSPVAVESAVMGATQRVFVPPPGNFAVIVVVDAARYDEFDLAHMPNLAKLVASGTEYTQAWVGQLPSVTETSHATIGTGVLPYRHGILGDTWRIPGKPQMSPNLLDGQVTRTGYIGQMLRQTHVPSLAALVHARFPGSIVATISGHKIYAADAMGAGNANFVAFGANTATHHFAPSAIPGHVPIARILTSPQLNLPSYPRTPGLEDSWTTTLAEKLLFQYHPRVLMINLPEVDVTGHMVGTNATVMQPLMTNIDVQIGRLVAAYTRARLINRTTFVITADHAMVPAIHTVDSGVVEQVIQAAGGDPLYIGHGDYSPIWLKDPAVAPRVAAALASANIPGVVAVYAKDGSGRYALVSPLARLADPRFAQAAGDLLQTFDTRSSPDIVLLYNENTITMTPGFEKIGRKGDHGGATWGAQHIPLILSGAGVRAGYVSTYPARLADIAPTVETLLGIQPRGQDGVPLADAMQIPPTSAVLAQNRVADRMTADVTALQSEAAARPNT